MKLAIIDRWRNVRVAPTRANWNEDVYGAMRSLAQVVLHAVNEGQAEYECDAAARSLMDEQAKEGNNVDPTDRWPTDPITGKRLIEATVDNIPIRVAA